ncbi:MAG: cytochrome C oxidase subunit II [Spirochaetales bacterium]|nr:cytochrome C oxidase subunit II [Spirochaetales bacterium]
MPLESPRNWWQPFNKEERLWFYIITAWAFVMFLMMPLGHLWNHNVPQETYKTTPAEFKQVTDDFIAKHQRKDAEGKPVMMSGLEVVDAPIGKDAFLIAQAWKFRPVLVLKKGQTYRIHMSSLDFQHGFSLQPQNLNLQILPDYSYVVTLQPNETGTFHIVCNEYCFYAGPQMGHDTMVGRIIVEE